MHPAPIQILSHIPGFVWAILVVILYFGFKQSTATAVRAKRLVVLPALWLVFGAWGVENSFGLDGLPGLAWLAGPATCATTPPPAASSSPAAGCR